MIPNQTAVWDEKHSKGDHELLRHTPSPFSEIAAPMFPRSSYILELGCGVGRDAIFFAQKGHRVLATDSSKIVIDQDKEHFSDGNVEFEVLDMAKPLPYSPATFDVVYANLSLHYYSDDKTQEIIGNISKVLKKGGILALACKSKDDARTKDAKEVEANIFVGQDNHALHLFSLEYTKGLMKDNFEVVSLDEVEEEYNGKKSNIVRCIAKNIGQNWGEL